MLLFWWLRIPLLTGPGVEKGWNSDHAVFGLMAQRLRDGGRIPVFYWGQSFLGPMTPAVAAGISRLRLSPRCEPVDLRLAAFLQHCLGMLAWGAGLWLLFGPVTAVGAMGLLSIGPAFFLGANTQPETLLFCGGLLFWLGARLVRGDGRVRPGQLVSFGMLSGFSWWMNPGAVFVMMPVLALLALRSGWYPAVREAFAPAGRLRFSVAALGWVPPRPLVVAAHAVQLYCFLRLLSYVTSPFTGFRVPGLLWHESLVEPLSLLALVHVGMALPGLRKVSPGKTILPPLVWAFPFAVGFAIGDAPPLLGSVLFRNEPSYSFEAALAPDPLILTRIGAFLGRTLLPFTSGSSSIAANIFAWGLVLGTVLTGYRRRARLAALLGLRPGVFGGMALAAGVVSLSFYFFLIRERSPGQVHYLVLAVPALFALAADGWLSGPPSRGTRTLLACALAGCGAVALWDGFRTARESILSEPDPEAFVQSIRRAGYSVCYANYWVSYKYQFLSRETVRFIPYHSRDRNPAQSDALRSIPGRKCLVSDDGTIREYLPEDERDQGGPGRRRPASGLP